MDKSTRICRCGTHLTTTVPSHKVPTWVWYGTLLNAALFVGSSSELHHHPCVGVTSLIYLPQMASVSITTALSPANSRRAATRRTLTTELQHGIPRTSQVPSGEKREQTLARISKYRALEEGVRQKASKSHLNYSEYSCISSSNHKL